MGGKWLSLLKEIAPGIKRAGIHVQSRYCTRRRINISWPCSRPPPDRWRSIRSSHAVRSDGEIETAVAALGAEQAGLVVRPPSSVRPFGTIISSTARHNVPAIFETRLVCQEGGLISYGADFHGHVPPCGSYVDRILRGEKPADLPVQTPMKFELIDQSENGKGARPRCTACAPRDRR